MHCKWPKTRCKVNPHECRTSWVYCCTDKSNRWLKVSQMDLIRYCNIPKSLRVRLKDVDVYFPSTSQQFLFFEVSEWDIHQKFQSFRHVFLVFLKVEFQHHGPTHLHREEGSCLTSHWSRLLISIGWSQIHWQSCLHFCKHLWDLALILLKFKYWCKLLQPIYPFQNDNRHSSGTYLYRYR